MKRRQAFFMTHSDVETLGSVLIRERPSVRFYTSLDPQVMQTLPAGRRLIHLADAMLDPVLEALGPLPWLGEHGAGVAILAGDISDDLMRSGELTTVFAETDPGQRAFVDDVFRALRLVTKPHVVWPDGRLAPPRIGPDAERWWRAKPGRRLMYWNSDEVVFRLRDVP